MVLGIAIAAMLGWPADQRKSATATLPADWNLTSLAVQQEPAYMGKPLSYWLRSLRSRDSEMADAFDAITALGPGARAAVPELTRIVGEPFTPVQIGVDERDSMIAKLMDIQLRADSIDALASIGEAAAPSSATLIQWALTIRVAPGATLLLWENTFRGARVYKSDSKDQERFIDLVTLDVLERMRVAGAIAQFGRRAIPAVAALMASSDDEGRKLAVAILSENALPIAAELLKSENCDEREIGLAILVDMWPVVPKEHLIALKERGCPQSGVKRESSIAHRRRLP
jgi:hypothetical protein